MNCKYSIGDAFATQRTISKEDVKLYGQLTGDFNPIHFDENYAKTTRFNKPIVHGMLIIGLISQIIGNHLPGEGTIYATQNIKFIKPVFIEDTIQSIVTIKNIDIDKRKYTLETICKNQFNEVVLEGEAIVFNYNHFS